MHNPNIAFPITPTTLMVPGSSYARYAPEPRSGGSFWTQARDALSFATSTVANLAAVPGAEQFQSLLQEQMRVQMVMQVVSMESNLLKSRHETEMAAVRNMRVG